MLDHVDCGPRTVVCLCSTSSGTPYRLVGNTFHFHTVVSTGSPGSIISVHSCLKRSLQSSQRRCHDVKRVRRCGKDVRHTSPASSSANPSLTATAKKSAARTDLIVPGWMDVRKTPSFPSPQVSFICSTVSEDLDTLELSAFEDDNIPLSALNRGFSIHSSADVSNAWPKFRTINHANQLSIYGAIEDWCDELTQQILGQSFSSKGETQCESERTVFFRKLELEEVNMLARLFP